jgi:rare lipoprotein A
VSLLQRWEELLRASSIRSILAVGAALQLGVSYALAQSESGMASVYSTDTGSGTASGAKLDPGALTAAHRSLPFGTRARVTNNSNGRSIVVTINDRGPFVRGRIIDLTPAAADALGFSGIAQVTVQPETQRYAHLDVGSLHPAAERIGRQAAAASGPHAAFAAGSGSGIPGHNEAGSRARTNSASQPGSGGNVEAVMSDGKCWQNDNGTNYHWDDCQK